MTSDNTGDHGFGTDLATSSIIDGQNISRRALLTWSALVGASVATLGLPERLVALADRGLRVAPTAPSSSGSVPRVYDLTIDELRMHVAGRSGAGIAVNGSVPGPLLRFREGDDAIIRVTNRLRSDSSIHWHGFLVPAGMDGVPGISFPGIKPGETFTYRFRVHQSGTYWYHSHSGGQEQQGVYGPIIIDPATPPPYAYDREYVVLLSDWSSESPEAILGNLKKESSWYNYHRRTIPQFFRALFHADSHAERDAIIQDRLMWARMRMDATDISDVTGATYTFLMNGRAPSENWTALFKPGERVRLRLINGSSMTFYDLKIPGLPMTVVQADGQDVKPVTVDEMRLGVAETYDVIVEPKGGQAYTIFAQAMDRSGYARGTIAEREGVAAAIPPMDPRPLRSMGNMGSMDMAGMSGMSGMSDMPGMDAAQKPSPKQPASTGVTMNPAMVMPMADTTTAAKARARDRAQDASGMAGMAGMAGMPDMGKPGTTPGMSHGDAPVAATPEHEMQASAEAAGNPHPGVRKLTYTDLRAITPNPDVRTPKNEVVMRLTGDMWRYFWTLNGKKLVDSDPIRLRLGERFSLKFINETMMDHPMHLHGVFMELQNGQPGAYAPRKHTVIVPPFETVVMHVTAIEPGPWAFHCHLLYHMMTGMFVKVIIDPARSAAARPLSAADLLAGA